MAAYAPANALNCDAAEQMGIGGIVETQASAQRLRDALVRGARAAGALPKGAEAGKRASAHAHALADSPCGAEEIGVTALGELLVDFTDAGETSDGRRLFERNPGGAPANVAVGAARLGVRAAFVGKIGADVNGRFLRGVLEREDVDCTGLIADAACATTLSFVEVSPDGERSFSFVRKPGADTQITPSEVAAPAVAGLIAHSRVLHVGTLSLTDEPARTATLEALAIARDSGCLVSFDPNYRADLWDGDGEARAQIASVLKFAQLVKLSDAECALACGTSDPKRAAAKLVSAGVPLVAVTLGAQGAYVRCEKGGCLVEAVPGVDVVDTTGAGDAFWAGFLAAFLESGRTPAGVGIDDARRFARAGNENAARCIAHRGAM